MDDASQIRYQVAATITLITLALIFSLALPAAGMVNHLIKTGEATIWRALLLWLAFSFFCFLLTWLFKPLIYRRVQERYSRQAKQQE